ncbi:NETI motif-containing protein [Salinicoccus sp. RF5]|uniref:NETI motif-containing protein n=1 Tax=Salinicoccus sp. RF5 TaxID=2748874 RepID=UPI001E4998D7|nr:NETI motif-containing protein [Salinicoccus sp. RF5]MCC4723439.1 NETI motif-containing protein [Salinicoccus sp. RF5]
MPKKKKFKVEEGEPLEGCLARMREEGYQPVRRVERPVFIEKDGRRIVDHQEIVFEGKKIEK